MYTYREIQFGCWNRSSLYGVNTVSSQNDCHWCDILYCLCNPQEDWHKLFFFVLRSAMTFNVRQILVAFRIVVDPIRPFYTGLLTTNQLIFKSILGQILPTANVVLKRTTSPIKTTNQRPVSWLIHVQKKTMMCLYTVYFWKYQGILE